MQLEHPVDVDAEDLLGRDDDRAPGILALGYLAEVRDTAGAVDRRANHTGWLMAPMTTS